MKTEDILGLFGGLALFLYGMNMMSEGLERIGWWPIGSDFRKINKS